MLLSSRGHIILTIGSLTINVLLYAQRQAQLEGCLSYPSLVSSLSHLPPSSLKVIEEANTVLKTCFEEQIPLQV
jgi:hypothetical protein